MNGLGDGLAAVNAALNFTSAVCLLVGLALIRARNVRGHRAAMTGAVGASALFLVFYLTRVAVSGTHEFAGQGPVRTAYLGILFSHMVLAVVVVPLVLRLLYLVWKRRFHDHARLARWTYPIWLYVSVTGIVVYLMLYRIYGYV